MIICFQCLNSKWIKRQVVWSGEGSQGTVGRDGSSAPYWKMACISVLTCVKYVIVLDSNALLYSVDLTCRNRANQEALTWGLRFLGVRLTVVSNSPVKLSKRVKFESKTVMHLTQVWSWPPWDIQSITLGGRERELSHTEPSITGACTVEWLLNYRSRNWQLWKYW